MNVTGWFKPDPIADGNTEPEIALASTSPSTDGEITFNGGTGTTTTPWTTAAEHGQDPGLLEELVLGDGRRSALGSRRASCSSPVSSGSAPSRSGDATGARDGSAADAWKAYASSNKATVEKRRQGRGKDPAFNLACHYLAYRVNVLSGTPPYRTPSRPPIGRSTISRSPATPVSTRCKKLVCGRTRAR